MAKIDKLLGRAKAHLDDGEQVLAAVQGTYETMIMGKESVRTGILLATPTRVVFFAKKLGGYDLESFPYRQISSFEQSKSMMGHVVTFFASGNKVAMKWIADVAAMSKFVEAVRGNLHGQRQELIPGTDTSQPSAPQSESAQAPDQIMEQIRQLGELHQTGVISDDEFSAKKAELLARL